MTSGNGYPSFNKGFIIRDKKMRVIFTGMVGLDKKSYLKELCQLAEKRGQEVQLCNVGDMMYSEAPDIPAGKILDIPLKRLSSLRRSVFKDIIAKSKKAENLFVNTHATFRWRHGLFPAVDFDQIRELAPDIYICLIDGVAAVHKRLWREHRIEHSLKDLIVWREEELIGTEMLRNGIDETRPFYCLALGSEKATIETAYRLIFEPKIPKAYISFPMTQVADMSDVKQEITSFRDRMKELFVCFDPADLEETYLPQYARIAEKNNQKFITVTAAGEKTELKLQEVKQIERDIYSQIYARDFMLIEQVDMIISFIPTLPDGTASISSGVERELQHAHESGKEVFVIWTAEKAPSVFVTQTATQVFSTLSKAVEFFEKQGYIKS